VGSWVSRVQREGLPPAISFTTYGGGVAISTSEDPLLGPAHGSWALAGERAYDTTLERILRGEEGAVSGTRRVRLRITVDASLDSYLAEGLREDLDFAGNVVDSGRLLSRATRISVQPVA